MQGNPTKEIILKSVIDSISWLLVRSFILNAVILTLGFALAFGRVYFEPIETLKAGFPIQLSIIAAFLVNLIYVLGLVFETIYLRLWKVQMALRAYESKFFMMGLVMVFFIYAMGVVLYFLRD